MELLEPSANGAQRFVTRVLAITASALGSVSLLLAACARAATSDELPALLADTGLYSDIATQTIANDVLAFDPQYPLWTDGATKRRWIRIPPGTSIDASDPDRFVFPRGTRLWKEFSLGRRVETRMLALGSDGAWRFASYVWDAEQRSATLAPEQGVPAACESAPSVAYDIPARSDCLACHSAGPNAVLGFNALQLSSDRDPLAPHAASAAEDALDLGELVQLGVVRDLPQRHVDTPPRIAAATPRERAALGYLNANCGMCHTSRGALAELGLDLSYSLSDSEPPALATSVDRPSRFRWPSDVDPRRISSATPDLSVLTRRMSSRQPLAQMPPLGTHVRDAAALELVTGWIREEIARRPSAGDLTLSKGSNPRSYP